MRRAVLLNTCRSQRSVASPWIGLQAGEHQRGAAGRRVDAALEQSVR